MEREPLSDEELAMAKSPEAFKEFEASVRRNIKMGYTGAKSTYATLIAIIDARDATIEYLQQRGEWFDCPCSGTATGHYFKAYIRSGESAPTLCNECKPPFAARIQREKDN